MSPDGGGDRDDPVTADGDRDGRDAGRDRGQASRQPGQRPERVDPGLMADERAGHRPGQPGHQAGDLARFQPFHRTAAGAVRSRPGRAPGRSSPARSGRPRPARSGPARVQRSRLARARSTNGSGSLHSCGSGVSRPPAPPVAPDAEPSGLDQQHRAQPGFVAGQRGGDAADPAADHQDVRPRQRDDARPAPEPGPFLGGQLITPDSSLFRHDPILCDPVTRASTTR